MKKWVKPFLIQKLTDEYDYCEKVKNMPALIRKSSLPSGPVLVIGDKRRHIFAPTAIFLTDDKSSGTALAHCLQCTFWDSEGYNRGQFTELFGSVLGRLPAAVFKKILEMNNVFFLLAPPVLGNVTGFQSPNLIQKGEMILVVSFPSQWYGLYTDPAMKGLIAHELAHVVCPADCSLTEEEIDEIVESWGFRKEIKMLKKESESVSNWLWGKINSFLKEKGPTVKKKEWKFGSIVNQS